MTLPVPVMWICEFKNEKTGWKGTSRTLSQKLRFNECNIFLSFVEQCSGLSYIETIRMLTIKQLYHPGTFFHPFGFYRT